MWRHWRVQSSTTLFILVQTTQNNLLAHQHCSWLTEQYCSSLFNKQCWTIMFKQQLTRLFHHSNFYLLKQLWTTIVGLSILNNVVETTMNSTADSSMLFNHDSRIVAIMFSHQYRNNLMCFWLCNIYPQGWQQNTNLKLYTQT